MNKKRLISALLLCSMAVFPTASMAQTVIPYGQTVTIGSDPSVTSKNTALNGGAVSVELGGIMNTTAGSKFENNISTNQYYGGGAIYNTGGTLNIADSIEFNNNHIDNTNDSNPANMSAGGAISSWNSGDVNIGNKVIFNHNGYNSDNKTASWSTGGAIYSDTNWNKQATLDIGTGAQFTDNTAGKAGAIYMGDTNATIGNGAKFEGNTTSSGVGGAVYVFGGDNNLGSNLTIGDQNVTQDTGVLFKDNEASSSGGAIYSYGQATTNVGSYANFTGNKSGGNGGAIYNSGILTDEANPNYVSQITATNATFSGNQADGNGGAIYNTIDNLTSGTLTAENYQHNAVIDVSGSFTNNSAGGMGGAIFNEGTANVSNATFRGNNAVNGGGALYNTSTGLTNLDTVIVQAGTGTAGTGNDIFNAGSITTDGVNTFASNIANNGTIAFDGQNTIASTSSVTGNGGIINNGTVNLGGNASGYTGTYTQTEADAVTTVTGTFYGGNSTVNGGTLNWNTTNNPSTGTLAVSGDATNLNIGTAGSDTEPAVQGNLSLGSGSSIASEVNTVINNGSSLTVNGGTASLNGDDTWNGGVILNSGILNIDNANIQQGGTIQANAGNLNITNGALNIGTGSAIKNEVVLTAENMEINTGGIVGVDDKDTLKGTTTLNGGTLNYGVTEDASQNVKIIGNKGYLNLLENSVLEIQTPSNIADAVVVDIQKGSTLQTNSGTTFNLNGGNTDPSLNDKWSGLIRNWGGTVNATNMVNDSTSALQQYGGTTNIDSNSNIILDNVMSEVTSGVVNVKNNSTLSAIDASILQGGDLNVDSTSKFVSFDNGFNMTNLNHSGSLIGLNNAIEDYTLTSSMNIGTTGDNQGDFTLDVYGRSNGEGYNDADRFFADVIRNASDSESATINISDWNLGGDIFGWDAPIDKHINLGRIFNYNTLEGNVNFTETDKEIFTPIGWYRLNNTGGLGGNYTMDLTRFNPQVYRGQVTTLAQWMNQLAIDDMLFNHSMLLPSFKEEDGGTAYTGMMANRYAATMPQYAPYQYSRKDGGLWVKMYGTFETLQMSQGLNNVGNNAYGTLIGADFGLKELKHGWKFMPTAYIGYNGAHQYYSGLGAYQNGGQAGFLGTWYKNNFIIGGLIYGGVYQNSLDIAGHTDNTFNYFAGAATKAAYNWRFHRDWVLQPNLLLAYNFFGQQNWHSDFGQMGMMSGILNGINLAPGLNLIWEKETFSIYATIQYMYNLNGAVGGRAGNVDLPHLYMDRGYIQYGFGFTKRFTDRFAGYFQTVFRNVGRTGVGFQLGFNFLLGK